MRPASDVYPQLALAALPTESPDIAPTIVSQRGSHAGPGLRSRRGRWRLPHSKVGVWGAILTGCGLLSAMVGTIIVAALFMRAGIDLTDPYRRHDIRAMPIDPGSLLLLTVLAWGGIFSMIAGLILGIASLFDHKRSPWAGTIALLIFAFYLVYRVCFLIFLRV